MDFNPRFPRGKRLDCSDTYFNLKRISIHASREGSDSSAIWHGGCSTRISIHASREGSDRTIHSAIYNFKHFNPRFPRGKRHRQTLWKSENLLFQSTLPAREATTRIRCLPSTTIDFNPRFPRGKRHNSVQQGVHHVQISIHASREGSDPSGQTISCRTKDFNPRFPRGKRQGSGGHHPETESDFNPRFPRGKRPRIRTVVPVATTFQSTLPAREATCDLVRFSLCHTYFNPRFPRGKRQCCTIVCVTGCYFNPRFPRGKRPYYWQ